jgi:DNA (cytosine-5)-methyltransferase 1
MMFKPLTESLGEELLMSYRAGFRAKTLVQQEKEQELMENGQECGGRWQGLLARYDPNTHSLRTVQCSLLEDLNESLQTWPKWGLMRNGECFQQPMLEQTISENEFGYVPNNENFFHTPNTTGLDGGSNSRKALKKRMEQWPTPDANCGQRETQPNWTPKRKSGHTAQYTINQAVRDKFPTPTAHNAKECNSPSESNRNTPTLATHAGGKLNPMWVEWLMGWPLGWTDLKPLETDKCHFVQQQHGTLLKED